MALAPEHVLGVIVGAICGLLILFRCGYRLFSRCRIHPDCHRTWHADDAYMAFAIVPLIARTTVIYISFELNPDQTFGLPTEADAAARGISTAQLEENYLLSHMLLLPARVSYLTYLWCLKLCLLNFYCRFIRVYSLWQAAASALWWALVVTYFAIFILIFTECRPINLYWDPDPDSQYTCHRALANLLTMGIFNIVTDIALILLPFPILRHSRLPGRQKVQLGILFGIGIIIVTITIVRLPLVVNQSLSIQARTTGATIEILGATIVANAAFYFALLKDVTRGHSHSSSGQASTGFRPCNSDGDLSLVSRHNHSGHGPTTGHGQDSSVRPRVESNSGIDDV
ncbi:hypothetical protein B0J13DRAFT_78599 [Dactylonectria estremocensis]|uniref:Rhodopsin domain-containing protein n=1 Tax=Dactylonectria estremocensis TaxID=1079267 RepID=A0A9P9EHF0_9HYPO|nr:hypothetical protein B0J13DRAFT_78599 [Dactylonectria estremocensis]